MSSMSIGLTCVDFGREQHNVLQTYHEIRSPLCFTLLIGTGRRQITNVCLLLRCAQNVS